ncbi:MAG: RuBisCO large subunit C-terminal-like domain-containing protein [Promethearchaeota archaeon]
MPKSIEDYDDKYVSIPEALCDGIDRDKYIIASYILSLPAKQDGRTMGKFAAIEQSTGTWIRVPAETAEVRKHHVARVVGVYEVPDYNTGEIERGHPDRSYFVRIAFPTVNIDSLPMLFTAAIGNISMAGKLKLVDLEFPKEWVSQFKGPKFGIDGIRKDSGVKERPLLNNMIKPCTGHTAKVGAELFYKAAVGGCDVVKDDELIANPKFNTLDERVHAYMEAADRASEEKGEKTYYTANVTSDLPDVLELANKVQDWGGNAIMINYLATGLSVMRAIAEDPSIKLPIMAHMDFAGVWYCDPWSGLSSWLTLGKLPRLCGADWIVTPAPYGKAPFMKSQFMEVLLNQTLPLYDINQVMPMPSGGITAGMVEQAIKDAGNDILIGSGGGIHAHPDGPVAGAKSFRQAIDAAMQGIPAKQYAKDHEELAKALGLWGTGKTKFQG